MPRKVWPYRQLEMPGLAAGRRLRDEGVASVDARHEAWKSEVLRVVQGLARTGKPFTSDDVRLVVTTQPLHDNAWGAAMIGAVRAGIIQRIGYRPSTRPEGHARAIGIYLRGDM